MSKSSIKRIASGIATATLIAAVIILTGESQPAPTGLPATPIKHVVIIMQENRSFDEYFGTFPGADGIPPGTCLPNGTGPCVASYHDVHDINPDAPHGYNGFVNDYDGGKMDGFVNEAKGKQGVMGYHDSTELPNYWAYAQNFVLQDHMFEPTTAWSRTSHLYMVSNWSATCADSDPGSCYSESKDVLPGLGPDAWTDITFLLHKYGISWAYYVYTGEAPDTDDGDSPALPQEILATHTASIWNPLPKFTDVIQDGEVGNVQDISNFYSAAANGTLPAVSWICPKFQVSEHAPAGVAAGQAYVTGLINAIAQGPDWNSTAIFVSWDDWGGMYDHVSPPVVDGEGYGFRVPGILISAYAKQGYIDHQTLSFDAYNKFIEDNFLGSQRLDPATDGRPDPRPDVREANSILGDLTQEFNFSQPPRPPLVLTPAPPAGKPMAIIHGKAIPLKVVKGRPAPRQ